MKDRHPWSACVYKRGHFTTDFIHTLTDDLYDSSKFVLVRVHILLHDYRQ